MHHIAKRLAECRAIGNRKLHRFLKHVGKQKVLQIFYETKPTPPFGQ